MTFVPADLLVTATWTVIDILARATVAVVERTGAAALPPGPVDTSGRLRPVRTAPVVAPSGPGRAHRRPERVLVAAATGD